ncbi:MAG: hypothetical protein H8E42_01175 [Nitrospinae bacterium]|nr:hypothetical protein [Nitrospinota bacterium]MBL7020060.1 hypothetical protein [Nitrospinaceae bacterium]
MTTDDQGKEKTPQERLDEIKREEKEDASGYYSQGSSKDNVNEEAELSRPVAPVQREHEEMNMLKAVAFLGFGMAALAIIFILFFVRDLDTRVMGMDGTVSSLEEKIAPLKKHVDDSFSKVNEDISGLKNKVGNYERMMAVMELKRALVTVQEMSMGNSPNVKAKSGEVVAGIEALLTELGAGPSANQGMPAGIVSLEEAPAPAAEVRSEPVAEEPAHAEEPVAEEPTHDAESPAEEPAPADETHAETAPEPEAESAPVEEAESSAGGEEDEDDEDDEDEDE